MVCFEGFIVAVFTASKQAYRKHATDAFPVFRGATRMVDTWGDDIHLGQVTDFRRAVQARDDEEVVLSWIEYPDKATRDAAREKIMTDESRKPEGEMPFAGQRMFWGGFEPIVDAGKAPAAQARRTSEPA